MASVVFYDVASKYGRCNSPHTWTTRLLLNYKNIPYETKWLEYPEIAPTLKSLNIAPHAEGTSYTTYTLPAVTIKRLAPDEPVHVMNSTTIAQALEDFFPEPTLHVRDETTAKADELLGKLMLTSFAAYMPLIPNILNPVSQEYYTREREALIGVPLADIYKAKGPSAYADSQKELQAWKEFFKQDTSGPFVRGQLPSFADFVFVAWLSALKEFNSEAFEQFVGFDAVFRKVFDACAEWRERNTY